MENQVNIIPKKTPVVLGERRFSLNKSRSKFVSVGVTADCGYKPGVILSGSKGEFLTFSEQEWEDFLSYQGIITNYVYSHEKSETVHSWSFSIYFEQIANVKVVKIEKDDSYIYLGYETICKLWEVLPIVKYLQNLLNKQDFSTYVKLVCYGLRNRDDNLFQAVEDIVGATESYPTENPLLILEFLKMYPGEFEEECRK